MSIRVIFFGSASDSVIVLEKLFARSLPSLACRLTAVVTQPPSPVGRKQVVTPTPVEMWARERNISVLSFPVDANKPWLYQNQDDVVNALSTFRPELLISACYGQKIPQRIISEAKFGGLNVHPSLLPRWRGADPVPWAILSGDRQAGVTIVTLTEKFDQGRIISRKKIMATDSDASDPLRTKLFTLGADLLIDSLPDYLSGKKRGTDQKGDPEPVARKLTRADGFIPWELLTSATEGKDVSKEQRGGIPQCVMLLLSKAEGCHLSCVIARMVRAFSPWPGVWTLIQIKDQRSKIKDEGKRMKILQAHVENEKLILDTVQIEGKNPVPWEQLKKAYPH